MKTNLADELRILLKAFLNSYAQVFFSEKKTFAVILLLVSFFDVYAGLSGLVAVISTLLVSYILGLDKIKVSYGWYGFNSLLVGLGLGVFFEPGWTYFFVLVLSSILTLFISVSMEGIIGKYALPYLSIPFIFSIWIVFLATRQFDSLGISERGIYTLNTLYMIGGKNLVGIYEWINSIELPGSLRVYFTSLGAIFFQFNVLPGIIIAFGLLYYSRIAFSLSLLGFYAAYTFYGVAGVNISELNYTYIGFNYILTSIALGGFFIIPSVYSYLWTIVLIPLVAVLTISLNSVFTVFNLPVYSLPFNIMVLMFLYVLKFRTRKEPLLREVYIQQNSPEKNLYSFRNSLRRFGDGTHIHTRLPFWGTWTISQAHDGKYTHKGEWKHAWDFVITGKDGKTFKNNGDYPEDYYCYDKEVLAPATGVVEEVSDGIEDNKIGSVNTINNWGNTVIIKHTEYLYSKLSHLKLDSIRVKKGEKLKQGEVIAKSGNSGRSPYPHLHFQFQATPFIGSKTLRYPFSHYIQHQENGFVLRSFSFPELDQNVSNVQVNSLLYSVFNLIPGKKIRFSVKKNGIQSNDLIWEIHTNVYNKSYIWCKETRSVAYFVNDGSMFYFTHFEGTRWSLLHYFYLAAFRIQLGYYQDLVVEDQIPLNHVIAPYALFFHDILAPFFFLFRADYNLKYTEIDNTLTTENIRLDSGAMTSLSGLFKRKVSFLLSLGPCGIIDFKVFHRNKEIVALCQEQ